VAAPIGAMACLNDLAAFCDSYVIILLMSNLQLWRKFQPINRDCFNIYTSFGGYADTVLLSAKSYSPLGEIFLISARMPVQFGTTAGWRIYVCGSSVNHI
jgi:hypothetical protein